MKKSAKTASDPLSKFSCKELLEILCDRGDKIKLDILGFSGREVTTIVAAKLLKRSTGRVRQLVRADRLVGHPSLNNPRRVMLPEWQFNAQGGVHQWVSELIRAYGSNGWALLHFVAVPRISLAGKNYLRQLKNGRAREVVAAARRANPDGDNIPRFEHVLGPRQLHALARKVFGAGATSWLRAPNPYLNGAVPLQKARTQKGAREVERLIGRIEHGLA